MNSHCLTAEILKVYSKTEANTGIDLIFNVLYRCMYNNKRQILPINFDHRIIDHQDTLLLLECQQNGFDKK